MRRLISIVVSFILGCSLCSSQEFYFKQIGLSEGLSQTYVSAIASDSRGSVWFGTRYGLNEYRNQVVLSYYDKGVEGLVGNTIVFIYTDSSDRLWVSTEEGLMVYDYSRKQFEKISDRTAHCAFEQDGSLYFGCEGGLLSVTDGNTSFAASEECYIIGLYPWKDRLLIVDKGLGLMESDGKSFTHLDCPDLDEKIILCTALHNRSLYLSVYRSGIYVLTGNRIDKYDSANSGLSFDVVLSLLDLGDKMWIGTDGGGLCSFDYASSEITRVESPANSITTLVRDSYDNIWMGTVHSGVYGLRRSAVNVLDDDVVNGLSFDLSGRLLVSSDGNGLSRYDISDNSLYRFATTEGLKVSSAVELSGGNFLLSIYSQGLNIFNPKTGRISPFTLVDRQTNFVECYYGSTPLLYDIGGGRILICAVHIYEYDPSNGSFTRFASVDNCSQMEMKLGGVLGDGRFCAYSPDGVFIVDGSAHSVRRISSIAPSSVAILDGTIWIGTQDGLFSMDLADGKFARLSTSLFKRVTSLTSDLNGNLWIAADNSLFRKYSDKLEIFGENEGFAPNEILSVPVEQKFPKVFLGGSAGLVSIDYTPSQQQIEENPLFLYGASLGGKAVDTSKGKLVLPAEFESLQISVGLNGKDPLQKISYRYDISGSSQYSIESYEDNIIFPDLKSGHYRVSVSYLLKDGSWSDAREVLSIRVRQPWYLSWWFLGLVSVILGTMLYLMSSYIYRRKISAMQQLIVSENSAFLGKLDEAILANLSDNSLDVPQIASELAMSRASLYQKVKKVTGLGVGQYIDELRMKEACRMLNETSMSVTEISEHVGYSSSGYFSTRFKNHMGCTPREYRNKNNS